MSLRSDVATLYRKFVLCEKQHTRLIVKDEDAMSADEYLLANHLNPDTTLLVTIDIR